VKKKHRTVSSLGEFALIDRILSRFSIEGRKRVLVGPGDDAAVLSLERGKRLLLTTDMLVEGTHFRLGWSYPEAVGYKAVTSNLSDVAAMGGKPLGIAISLGVPRSMPVDAVDRLYAGVRRALRKFGGDLLGGDTIRSNRITVSVTAVGFLTGTKPLLRSGARPGNSVCVTGALGAVEAGLLLLKRHFSGRERSRRAALAAWGGRGEEYFRGRLPSVLEKHGSICIQKHLMPDPRVREALVIAGSRPSSMIDLSDGLYSDLGQIAKASAVGVCVDQNSIPIHPAAKAVAENLGVSPRKLAGSSGEEYELLFTIPESRVEALSEKLVRTCGADVTLIGEVTRRKGALEFIRGTTGRDRLVHRGFKHF
jgi:thiamine-monophosphate kinase